LSVAASKVHALEAVGLKANVDEVVDCVVHFDGVLNHESILG